MKLEDLPIKLMRTELSCPNKEGFDRLQEYAILDYITKKYSSIADRADAFDGAFTAFQIDIYLSRGAEKEDWLIEVLGFYDYCNQKDIKGPFFDGLRTTLSALEREDFYEDAINYIISNK